MEGTCLIHSGVLFGNQGKRSSLSVFSFAAVLVLSDLQSGVSGSMLVVNRQSRQGLYRARSPRWEWEGKGKKWLIVPPALQVLEMPL